MRYWIGIASKEHVIRGVKGGFAQVCHGKEGPLKQMQPRDWIIYYSPTIEFGGKNQCRAFTALGQIEYGEPYAFRMSADFVPYRRNVKFLSTKEISILPLIDSLTFIQDKKKWGFPFRRGCFCISEEDFHIIAVEMGITTEKYETHG